MAKKPSVRGASQGSWDTVQQALATVCSNLYGLTMRQQDDVSEVRFKHRGGGDWLVILKTFDDDGTPMVAFGQGYDFISALLSINGTIASGRYRVDKPYQPK